MADMVKVTYDGKEYEYEVGTSYEKIAGDFSSNYKDKIIIADVDHHLVELNKKIKKDCVIDFRTVSSRSGFHVYSRTILFVMMKAICELYNDALDRVKVEFAISGGVFCTIDGKLSADDDFCEKVTKKMQEIIDADLPIVKDSFYKEDAVELLEKQGFHSKVSLFRFRRSSRVNLYCLDGYYDYYLGFLAPSTGYISAFKLTPYESGFVVQFSDRNNLNSVQELKKNSKQYNAMLGFDQVQKQLGIETVSDLNEALCSERFTSIYLGAEAFQEGKISDIAATIANRPDVKFVMIAGPSSSGKTSFSYRLSTQLITKGLNPHPIGLDNYYKDREFCPKDEDGNYDFECLEALDVEGFNNDMVKLLNGETVDIPVFNFKTGHREYHGNYITLKEGDVLVIEGIHGLNEKMSYALPKESKFKVYISALTTLNVDEHNRIPTTDVRLLRRMVRDNMKRGTSASQTIAMWDSVRRGEEKYIFPFQEEADVYFNSALIYEIAILKQFAEPLLFEIDKEDNSYHEAERLLKFLEFFLGVTTEGIANNSLMREFVGGSIFNV